jgi:amino acid transporter
MSQASPSRSEGTQLQRRVLSNVEVFAQSIGGIAPVLGAVAITPLLVSYAGSGAWITVLLAMIVALAVGACLVTVAREHVSSGGIYSLVPQGLGQGAGFIAGCTMLAAALVTGVFILFGIGLAAASLCSALNIVTLSSGDIYVFQLIIIAIVTSIALRRVSLSANVMLLVEAISVTVIVAIMILVLVKHSGSPIDAAQFTLKGATFHGVIVGCVFGILDFGGFDSGANLGFEARNPRRAVPLAVLGSVFTVGIFLIVSTYVQVLGFSGLNEDLAKQAAPLAVLSQHFGASWLGNIIIVGVIISWFSASTAWLNFGTRLTVTMSGDRILPRRLASTTRGTGAPLNAIFAIIAVYFAIITYVFATGGSITSAFGYTGSLEGYTLIIYYAMMVIAAPVWAWRRKKLGALTVISAIIALVGLAGLSYYTVVPFPPFPTSAILIGFGAFVVAVAAVALTLRLAAPKFLARVGTTEEAGTPSKLTPHLIAGADEAAST